VNVNWQEVFAVFYFEGQLFCSWHLAHKPLSQASMILDDGSVAGFSEVEWNDNRYEPGGQDQIQIVAAIASATQVMENSSMLQAMRTMNLRLMRKGACNFARYHCLALADHVYE
jgi:hypothetical protein